VGGDVGFDYDIQFLNTGVSAISSEGPLQILAGDANHAENLTLGTQGTGDVVVDINDSGNETGGFKILGNSGHVLRVNSGGAIMLGGDQQILIVDNTTPDVSSGTSFITANTASTTISDFVAGSGTLEPGHLLFLEINDGNTTFDCDPGTNLDCGDTDIVGEGGDMFMWYYDGTDWKLVSYMQNIGTQAGLDIAELFPSNEELEPGDLVTIDVGNPVRVKKTSNTYDTRMIGIVSTNPGITLGEEVDDEDTFPIALAGRVETKVSLEGGEIHIGDLITSSLQEGVGMRATGMGRTIGYALESFNETNKDGKILVFIDPSWSPGAFDTNGLFAGVEGEEEPQQGGFIGMVKSVLRLFTGTVQTAGNWVFESITTKVVRVEKLELVDQGTGKVYCTWIADGDWVRVQGACSESTPEPASSDASQGGFTPTPTPTPTPQPTGESTPEPSPTPTPEITSEPTAESTPEPSPTPTSLPAGGPESTPEPTPTPELTPEPTPTPEPTTTPTPTPEPSPTGGSEPTAEPTPEPETVE